ncbi:MAG TPA: 1-acyl-sn-glycerol-3-phosphate acyltransferase [Anaerolineae bacterium]|nr:1-acyl-sn-glycerol-3-phosphate acyltransferase [Anaerolineae bacterium]
MTELNAPVAADPQAVRQAVLREFFWLLGLPEERPLRRALQPVLGPVVGRFTDLAAEFDQSVARVGLPAAIRPYIPRFTRRFMAVGADHVPDSGPALLVSNHPGAYDLFGVLSQLPRADVRVIVSDISILRHLPATSPHFILIGRTEQSRMTAVRAAVRHLREGGVLFIFPGGIVDPDPAFMPGAAVALQRWSPSLELFLRRAPETQVVSVVVSGVLSPAWLRSPVTRLREQAKDRQKVAEAFQVIQQLLLPGSLRTNPLITFGPPLPAVDLLRSDAPVSALQAIVDHQRVLLLLHKQLRALGLAP